MLRIVYRIGSFGKRIVTPLPDVSKLWKKINVHFITLSLRTLIIHYPTFTSLCLGALSAEENLLETLRHFSYKQFSWDMEGICVLENDVMSGELWKGSMDS